MAKRPVARTCEDFVHVGFLTKLLDGLKGSWIAHCTTGPLRKDAPVDGIVETDHFSIMARLILGSVDGFCQAVQRAAPMVDPSSASDLNSIMKWLLEEWFSHFENVGDPVRRKLMCLALTKLLETNQSFILANLQLLMTIWTDVINELREDDADAKPDSLVYGNEDAAAENGEMYPESPEGARRKVLMYADIVHNTELPGFVKGHLQAVIAAQGGEARFQEQWLVNVDRDVLEGFAKLGIM